MSEGLASYQGQFPVNDRTFEYLRTAKSKLAELEKKAGQVEIGRSRSRSAELGGIL